MHKSFAVIFLQALRPRQAQITYLSLLFVVLTGCGNPAMGIEKFEKFRKFEEIYEPSGVQQLPDGRFLVVEDEAAHPLDVFSLKADGDVIERPLYRSSLLSWNEPNRVMSTLEDLEAMAIDDQGRIYAITSHSRKESGKREDKREQLVRFRLHEDQIVDFKVIRGLRKLISAQHPSLKKATKIRDVKDDGGFNIEGLSFDAAKQNLLLGLRSPQAESAAIILVLENVQTAFDHDEKPLVSERLIRLDLDKGGIRALSYDPHLQGFLIVSRKTDKSFKLWLWSGEAEAVPRRIKIPGIKSLRQAEGVTPVRSNGRAEGILIVSDEGDGVQGKPGRYLFLSYDQLEID